MTRLLMRVATSLGPRIVITQDLAAETAWAISNALEGLEITTYITEESTPVNLKNLLRRRKKSAPAIVPEAKSNVTALQVSKRPF